MLQKLTPRKRDTRMEDRSALGESTPDDQDLIADHSVTESATESRR